MSDKKQLLLIFDGHALVHRAFHALPPLTVPRTGEMVNEVWTAWQGPSKPTAKPSQAASVKQAEGQRMALEAAQQ